MKRLFTSTRKLPTWMLSGAALVAIFISLSAWGLSSPPGSSPDDNFHGPSIWCGWGEQAGLCESTGVAGEREVPVELLQYPCFAFHPETSGICMASESSTLGQLAVTDHGSFDNEYPPVFYGFMRTFVSQDTASSLLAMRLVNALIFCVIVAATWLVSSPALRRVQVLMWAVTLVPLGMFLIPSNNPSSWAIMAIPAVFLSLIAFFANSGRKQFAALSLYLMSVLLASGSRADAAVYVIVVSGIAIILSDFFTRASWHWSRLKLLVAPLVGSLFSAGMFLSTGQADVAVEGMPIAGGEGAEALPSSAKIGLLIKNIVRLPELYTGVFGQSSSNDIVSIGNLGWLDTQMPIAVWLPTLFAASVALFVGLSRMSWNKAIAISALLLVMAAMPLYILQKSQLNVGAQIQPRYLYPLLIVLIAAALMASKNVEPRFTTLQIGLLGGLVAGANFLALHLNIRRYVTGIDLFGPNLNKNVEWWWNVPLSPMADWIIGSVAFALALVASYKLAWSRSTKDKVGPTF